MLKRVAHWLLSALVTSLAPFVVVAAITTAVVFFSGDSLSLERDMVEQPVLFNHLKHVEEVELDCATCHPGCQEGVSSGLPSMSACALCHEEPQGESKAEMQLVAMIEERAPLVWGRLFQQPAHVFFSHRRHTQVAGIECETCHGGIGQSTAPPVFRAALRMEDCITCHEEQGAPVDCSTCHR